MQCLSAKYNVKVIYTDVKNYNVRIDRNLKNSNDKHQISYPILQNSMFLFQIRLVTIHTTYA